MRDLTPLLVQSATSSRAQAVVHGLRGDAADRADGCRVLARHAKVDAVFGGVELHIGNSPRRLQTRCAGEQRFIRMLKISAPATAR